MKRWRWSFGVGPYSSLQVIRVDRAVGERDLIVVGVVEGFRQRVGRAQLIAVREAFLDAQEQPVVLRLDARFQVHDQSGPPTTGLKTVPMVRPMMKCVPKLCR